MKEYMGGAVNILLSEIEPGKLMATAELIVLVSEPVFEADTTGQMIRRRDVGQIRFAVNTESIRKLIHHLEEYANEMDDLEAKFVERPQEAVTT